MVEIFIFGLIIVFLLVYTNVIDKDKFLADNEQYFKMLKEDDYEFLVYARYGDSVDVELLYRRRVVYAIIVGFAVLIIFLNNLSLLNICIALVATYLVFKMPYNNLKSFYKKHLHDIDVMLPYYLKSLEILIQHYTVPVAIGKSLDDENRRLLSYKSEYLYFKKCYKLTF